MKIQSFSDLHLERFRDQKSMCDFLTTLNTEADCVIMAGDIFGYHGMETQMKCVADVFNNKEIVFIPGNHEYYSTDKKSMDNDLMVEAKRNGIIFLENNYHMLDNNFIIIGACGWHDSFNTKNCRMLNDFKYIEELKNDPMNSIEWNHKSKKFFIDTLEKFSDKKCICVTHNSPLIDFIPYKYMGSVMNQFFVNDWSDIIDKYQPVLWISGHNHQHFEKTLNNTLLIENGYGYYNHDLVYKFDKKLIVDLI